MSVASSSRLDFKSLSHACRLIFEAEEFLTTGKVTLPRPEAEFILAVKQGRVEKDWFTYLFSEIDRLEKVVLPASTLPAQPDRAKINQMCIDLQLKHLNHG